MTVRISEYAMLRLVITTKIYDLMCGVQESIFQEERNQVFSIPMFSSHGILQEVHQERLRPLPLGMIASSMVV